MKGLIVDCKRGDTKEVDDGLPVPRILPCLEPQGFDLAQAAHKLNEFDQIKADLDELKNKKE